MVVNATLLMGRAIEWNVSTAVLVAIFAQIVLAAAALGIFLFLTHRKKALLEKENAFGGYVALAKKERNLIGISLDTSSVKREFRAGEAFDSEGLLVTARYDKEPSAELLEEGYAVEAPSMEESGERQVVVRYGGFTASYFITVLRDLFPAEEERRPIAIDLDLRSVRTEFTVGDIFDCSGLAVTAHYATAPYEQPVADYTCDVPDLLAAGIKEVVVRYMGLSYVYPVTVTAPDEEPPVYGVEEAFYAEAPAAVEVAEEEIAEEIAAEAPAAERGEPFPAEGAAEEGSVLRYERSFTARVIQSDEETKRRYNLIKNELLSYENVKGRMSWRKETFRAGGGNVARLGFRGNILCLYLPLDPAEFAGSRYKVEQASEGNPGEKLPCLFRIKNEKRARLACELIARVMGERGAKKGERPAQDYAPPYETTEQLLGKGLIRAVLRGRVDGSLFADNENEEGGSEQ